MIEQKRQVLNYKKPSKKNAPSVLPWKGVAMVRHQSFLATVKEIIDYSDEMDVVRIGIIGDMMSGKSTLSETIGHAVHIFSKKTKFSVRVFYKDDLKNFKGTMSQLAPANYILIFDDVSFLKASTSSQGIAMIEDEVSTIRHMVGGKDVKIILILNFHYPKALPPFLREFHFKYITSIGTDNERVIADNYGTDNVKLVTNFKTMRKRAITNKAWFESVGNDRPPVRYLWRSPFIPVLFWNEATMRKVVTPTRYFMDDICSTCDEAEGQEEYDEKEIPKFLEDGKNKHTGSVFMNALKLVMHSHGYPVHKPSVQAAVKWIEGERLKKRIPLKALMRECGMKPHIAYMRKKLTS